MAGKMKVPKHDALTAAELEQPIALVDRDVRTLDKKIAMKPTNRCTGHCCRAFFLPLSFEEVCRRLYAPFVETRLSLTDPSEKDDFAQTVRMLIPIDKPKESTHCPEDYPAEDVYWYTCENFDGRDCLIYEDRPSMCRDYPYGTSCKYQGCTEQSRPPDLVPVEETLRGMRDAVKKR